MRIVKILLTAASLWVFVPSGALVSQEPESRETRFQTSRPFSTGERLVYLIKWDPPWYLFFLPAMEAGQAELQLLGETEYKNQTALKISFTAHSSGRFLKLVGVKVDDEFTFITDAETFCTLSASKRIHEGKRKRLIDVEYLRDAHQLHLHEMDESVVPPTLKKDEIKDNIPACVHDPFSALYLLRMSELRLHYSRILTIGHDDRVKDVQVRVEKKEILDTALGKFVAWNINTSALMGGLFKGGGQFRIWLSADSRKLPLQFEVKVSLGKVLGRLKSADE
jgi:hypothetical protein